MKMYLYLSAVFFLCFCSSCKKNTASLDSGTVPPTIAAADSIPFPLKRGTWWKYQRADTTTSGSLLGPGVPKMDTSTELITVIGKINITDSVQGTMLEVRNLTLNKKDTNYVFYYRTNFIVSTTFPQDITVYAENKYLGAYDLRFRIPLVEGNYSIANNTDKGIGSIYDTVIIRKDTSINMLNNTFSGSLYAWEKYNYFGGAYSHTSNSQSIMIKNIGFAFWLAGAGTYNHYGISSNTWFVRRLIDYYITP